MAPVHAADEPVDPDFLEFLGSVDSNEAGWHDYLAQTDVDQVAKAQSGATKPANPGSAASRPTRSKGRATMKSQCAWLLTGMLLAQCAVSGARAVAAARTPPRCGAGTPAAPLAWKDLQPNQQQLLQSYAQNWDSLPAARQQALARGARRWSSMDPAAARRGTRALPGLAEIAGGAAAADPQALGAVSAARSAIKGVGAAEFQGLHALAAGAA